jgi:hypothetical protein
MKLPVAYRGSRLLLVVAVCLACQAKSSGVATGDAADIPLRALAVRAEFPYTVQQPETAVLPDAASWAVWQRRTRAVAPSLDVNWAEEGVVALVTPEFSDGPTVVSFERARLMHDTLVVEYRFIFPAMRKDYGSQERAAAIPGQYLEGHPVRFQQLPSKEEGLAAELGR